MFQGLGNVADCLNVGYTTK